VRTTRTLESVEAVKPALSRRLRPCAVALLVLLAGCAQLLPHSRSEEPSPFSSFEAARAAMERVEPHRTTLQELSALGLDPNSGTNVREIPYPQFVSQLVESPFLSLGDLDPGLRECIAVRERCRAYQFHFSKVDRERTGSFLLDFLNFERTTQTTGWRFEGVVLVRDDGVVLFRNHAGEARIATTEHAKNPLGPFQSIDFLRR
jgi:hypothetical protein